MVVLTADNFEDEVVGSKDTWVVEFFAPWCGFCKQLKDTWIELATGVKGKAKIGAVDCTKHRTVCSKYGVNGYPTLKKFGADKAKPEEYEGDRSIDDLKTFATGMAAEAKKEDEFYSGTGEREGFQPLARPAPANGLSMNMDILDTSFFHLPGLACVVARVVLLLTARKRDRTGGPQAASEVKLS